MLNTEAGLLIFDEKFSDQVRQLILNTVAPQNSWTVGVRRKIPVLGFFSSIFENIFKVIPFFNVWPFQYTTSYELNDKAQPLPFYHRDFHDNYHAVGQFPGSNVSAKALKTRLTKAFFGPAEPLI